LSCKWLEKISPTGVMAVIQSMHTGLDWGLMGDR